MSQRIPGDIRRCFDSRKEEKREKIFDNGYREIGETVERADAKARGEEGRTGFKGSMGKEDMGGV
jgi:hypothetical protein